MLLNSMEMMDRKIVTGKINKLVKLLLNPVDAKTALGIIGGFKCLEKDKCRVDIPATNYSEFFIETERQQGSMTIRLKYYMA